MEGINKKYNLEIEVLTPLSIGAGQEKDWVRGVDFVVDKGTLYKLNLKKMIDSGVDINDLTGYFASKNESGLKSKLADKLDEVSDFSMSFPAETDNDVKAFVKNQLGGNPVLTGSSLKGAIRSVLLDYIATKDEIVNAVSEANQRRKPFESFIFGSSNDGDEFMRFIKISDAEFDQTELVNTKIFNLRGNGNNWQGGWKHQQTNRDGNSFTDEHFKSTGFNTLYESLMPKQKGYASLMMSETLFDLYESKQKVHIKSPQKRPILHSGFSSLFEIINKHTNDYLLKEKAFFEKFHAERSDEIVDSIDALLNQIPSDDSCCILKMSAGSGFHSITGDWQFSQNYTNGKFDRKRANKEDLKKAGIVLPKSRKIAIWNNHFYLMGFVRLRVMSDEEVKQLEEIHKAEMLHKEQERQAQIEAKRIKAEQEAEEQREKEERKKLYDKRIAEVKLLIDAEQYENALDMYFNTCDEFPNFTQNIIDVDLLGKNVNFIRLEKKLAQSKQAEEEQRRQANAVPLAEKIANAQKIPTLCGNVKTWMKINGVESLNEDHLKSIFGKIKDIVSQMKPKDRDRLKNFGKELDSLVGSDMASNWFNEIVHP